MQGGPRGCGWHGPVAKRHRDSQAHASTSFAGWSGRFPDSKQMEILHAGFGAENLPLSWTLWARVFWSSSCGGAHRSGEHAGLRRKEAFRMLWLFLLAGVGISSVYPDSSEFQHPSSNTLNRAEVVQRVSDLQPVSGLRIKNLIPSLLQKQVRCGIGDPSAYTSNSYQRLEPWFSGGPAALPSPGIFHPKIFHLAHQRKESWWSSSVGWQKHSTTVRPTHVAMPTSEELPTEAG